MFFLKELPTNSILTDYAKRYPDMNIDIMNATLPMLRRASLLIRQLEAYFTEHDLSQTRFLILIILDREIEQKPLRITDIVARLDVSKPVITNTLKALEKDGFINIRGSKIDQRTKTVLITSEGREKLASILPGYYKLMNEEHQSYNS